MIPILAFFLKVRNVFLFQFLFLAVLSTVFLQEDGLSADAGVPILCSSQSP